MFPSLRPSQRVAVLAAIPPASLTADTSAVSAYVKADQFANYLAVLQTGVLGASGTLDAKIVQATSAAGAGVKDVAGKSITQIVKASGDNKQALINLRPDELDIQNNYTFFALSVTAGTAAALGAGVILGLDARFQPPANASSMVQAVI